VYSGNPLPSGRGSFKQNRYSLNLDNPSRIVVFFVKLHGGGMVMKKFVLGMTLCALIGLPALAALKTGEKAPDFSAKGSLAGKEFDFSLQNALKKGPVVVYFFPSAYTKGCDLEAHTFAQEKDKFDAAGATIIGVSADSLARLNMFSADPDFCAGKFPVASDADGKIASSYDLNKTAVKPGMKDVRGADVDHDLIERTTFVIGKDHKIIATLSSKDDGLSPDAHVAKSLEIVQKLGSK
jgi:peroxiredoxin Q/BCP